MRIIADDSAVKKDILGRQHRPRVHRPVHLHLAEYIALLEEIAHLPEIILNKLKTEVRRVIDGRANLRIAVNCLLTESAKNILTSGLLQKTC